MNSLLKSAWKYGGLRMRHARGGFRVSCQVRRVTKMMDVGNGSEGAPGSVLMSQDKWSVEHRDSMVVYSENDGEGKSLIKTGIVRRPSGRRKWVLQDSESGEEKCVDRYLISFQWPPYDDHRPDSFEKVRIVARQCTELVSLLVLKVHPREVWEHFYASHRRARTLLPFKPTLSSSDAFSRLSGMPPEFIGNLRKINQLTTTSIATEVSTAVDMCAESADCASIELRECAEFLYSKAQRVPVDTSTSDHLLVAHLYMLHFPDYFMRNSLRGFYCVDRAIVEEKLLYEKYEQVQAQIKNEFIEKLNARLKFVKNSDGKQQLDSDDFALGELEVAFIRRLKAFALGDDSDAYVDVINTILHPLGYGDKPHHAFDLLVNLGLISRHDNPHMMRWKGPLKHLKSAQIASESAITRIDKRVENFVDMTDTMAFVFANRTGNTSEHAISLYTDSERNEWVVVHVLNVSSCFEPNSVLDLSARRFASSILLPDAHYGMFPPQIYKHVKFCENSYQRCIGIAFTLSPMGTVAQWHVLNTQIKNITCLSYEQLDAILNSNGVDVYHASTDGISGKSSSALKAGSGDINISQKTDINLTTHLRDIKSRHLDSLRKLIEIAIKHRATRLEKSALIVPNIVPDITVVKRPPNSLKVHVGARINLGYGTEGLLSEFELLAGHVAACFFSKYQVPSFYIAQDVNEKLRRALSFQNAVESSDVTYNQCAQNLAKKLNLATCIHEAELKMEPTPNKALGLSVYTRIVSPLSNYLDLINQQQVTKLLQHSKTLAFTAEELTKIIPSVCAQQDENTVFQKNATRYWILGCIEEMYKHNVNKTYQAIVLSSSNEKNRYHQYEVLLIDFGLETKLESKKSLHPGQIVKLSVNLVNSFYDTLILKISN